MWEFIYYSFFAFSFCPEFCQETLPLKAWKQVISLFFKFMEKKKHAKTNTLFLCICIDAV